MWKKLTKGFSKTATKKEPSESVSAALRHTFTLLVTLFFWGPLSLWPFVGCYLFKNYTQTLPSVLKGLTLFPLDGHCSVGPFQRALTHMIHTSLCARLVCALHATGTFPSFVINNTGWFSNSDSRRATLSAAASHTEDRSCSWPG